MGTCLTTGGGPQKLDIFETTLQSSTLVETHSATKGIQEWMKRGSFANYCCEHSLDVFFSPPSTSHKQSFLPLSPAIERDALARRDWMDGVERSSAERGAGSQTAHFTSGATQLSYDCTHSAHREFHIYIFLTVSFNYAVFVRQKFQTCKISAYFYPVWIKIV